MQQIIKIKTPAKINLTLEVLDKRTDGFHNIQSIMQAISLFDYLTIQIFKIPNPENQFLISGNSEEIPYDEKNIAYKAAKLYLDSAKITNTKICIHIEKNIPVCAGLAGGSTNASGVLYGLNKIFQKFNHKELHHLASTLGSDLNFCLDGGCALCTGRGEFIEKLPTAKFDISLIKPKNLKISAKEAYQKFSILLDKSHPNNTTKLKQNLLNNNFNKDLIYNSLEKAVINDYKILQEIKQQIPKAIMSGSGPTFFVLNKSIENFESDNDFEIINNLTSVNFGVEEI